MNKLKRGASLRIINLATDEEFVAVFLAQGPLHFVVLMLDNVKISSGFLDQIIALEDGVECDRMYDFLKDTQHMHILGHVETLKCVTGQITDDSNTKMKIVCTDEHDMEMDLLRNIRDHVQNLEDWKTGLKPNLDEFDLCIINILRGLQEVENRVGRVNDAMKGTPGYDAGWMNSPFYPVISPKTLLKSIVENPHE